MGMVDISEKNKVPRQATAKGKIKLCEDSLEAIKNDEVKKGSVFEVAEISAIQAVKDTPRSLPHCHPIPIEGIEVDFEFKSEKILEVRCEVKAIYKTGVEMESLVGVNAALLTVWDMVKYIEKDKDGQYPNTRIENVTVTEKRKGDPDGS